ncbi:hypothetical protein BZG36_04273 [Bifiguratus adelaidae]|uniref:GPI inositol-deacylase n=1 Tax=Bifiguratus adelaidae TaxID=1938954 RepID=A0A261XWQ3_9FUNG|nr:hypothetical protein BZG36_04273 [Bifiguratus adelaidae]
MRHRTAQAVDADSAMDAVDFDMKWVVAPPMNAKEDKGIPLERYGFVGGPYNGSKVILLLVTALSFWTRYRLIDRAAYVVWDEAHFGKFASHYLKREFYFDVHPPLGKILVAFSGLLAGYDGSFSFDSGEDYPAGLNFGFMRLFSATFGALIVPLAYESACQMGYSGHAALLSSIMILLDLALLTISRFILLDSMLLFFTCISLYCMLRFNNLKTKPFSMEWKAWLLLTGVSLGCVLSVKWVGLFAVALVGLQTIEDLWVMFGDLSIPKITYAKHWVARIIGLIIVPFAVYMFSFYLHFAILSSSGPGDSQMSSLFQAHLKGNTLYQNPVGYGGGLLHSHVQKYPGGSNQQQVTCYHHKDANNYWQFRPTRVSYIDDYDRNLYFITDGAILRLTHNQTGTNLHSHDVKAPITTSENEVSCYGNDTLGDANDYWQIEVVDDVSHQDHTIVRALTTRLRLLHTVQNCYLAARSVSLPQWGFKQIEVTCEKESKPNDAHQWWNIEEHINDRLPAASPQHFKQSFLRDFWHLNVAMWTSNNALVPDADKFDALASSPTDWPFLRLGLRMCAWDDNAVKYFLLGNPIVWWSAALGIVAFGILLLTYLIRRKRHLSSLPPRQWDQFCFVGKTLIAGWALHYLPFGIMGRVTYLHHYFPAVYFAALLVPFLLDHATQHTSIWVKNIVFGLAGRSGSLDQGREGNPCFSVGVELALEALSDSPSEVSVLALFVLFTLFSEDVEDDFERRSGCWMDVYGQPQRKAAKKAALETERSLGKYVAHPEASEGSISESLAVPNMGRRDGRLKVAHEGAQLDRCPIYNLVIPFHNIDHLLVVSVLVMILVRGAFMLLRNAGDDKDDCRTVVGIVCGLLPVGVLMPVPGSGGAGRSRFVFICITCIIAFYGMIDSYLFHQRDAKGCNQTYMRPSFIRLDDFDSEKTRFAGKYALHLYREKTYETTDYPVGVPVLFIPGHAGSYKQTRSFAAEASYYYHDVLLNDPRFAELHVRELDFFTVDFNEEFSALHGQSLLEQAEYLNDAIAYILSLYRSQSFRVSDPSSVIIIGHSMGGIVARAMFTMKNYQPGTITTIITMSTPHILPPAAFDGKISRIYATIDDFWKRGFRSPHGDLLDVTMISIAGGNLDSIVSSDSADVRSIIPSTHGFTVYTTSIPHVWVGNDHPSILWCNQLVKVVVRSLLDIVDVRRKSQVMDVEARMRIFRRSFLNQLDVVNLTRRIDAAPVILHLNDITHHFFPQGRTMIYSLMSTHLVQLQIMPIPVVSNDVEFHLVTDQDSSRRGRLDFLLCSRHSDDAIACKSASEFVDVVPSSASERYPFSGKYFSFLRLSVGEMKGRDYMVIVDKGGNQQGFVVAEFSAHERSNFALDQSALSVHRHGLSFSTASSAPIFLNIRIPHLSNQLFAYRLQVQRPGCQLRDSLFTTLVRQSVPHIHESKFFVGDREIEISFHGEPGFFSVLPPHPTNVKKQNDGLVLQFWSDPKCTAPLQFKLSLDLYGSFGRIVTRYATVIACFPLVIVLLTMGHQIGQFYDTGVYPEFSDSLVRICQKSLPLFCVFVSVCSIYQSWVYAPRYTAYSHEHSGSQQLALGSSRYSWSNALLGNGDWMMWWLSLLFIYLSLGVVILIWAVLSLLIHTAAIIVRFTGRAVRQGESTEREDVRKFTRRVITTLILFILVATAIPYQFAFIVAFLVHTITCTCMRCRALYSKTVSDVRRHQSRFNYMQSIHMLLFFLLPFTVPVLMVWIRNLSVHWFAPFSSDHNILAIGPFMMFVELLTVGKTLPRESGIMRHATVALMYLASAYGILFGKYVCG